MQLDRETEGENEKQIVGKDGMREKPVLSDLTFVFV